MSTFGDGTLKQKIYERVSYLAEGHSSFDFLNAMLEVAMYMFDGAESEEEGYKKGYAQAMLDVKRKLGVEK